MNSVRATQRAGPGFRRLVILVLCGAVLCAATASSPTRETGFLDRTVTVSATTYRYQVYVPVEWNKKTKSPVVLFLHGAGERGDNGLFQTELGVGRAIRRQTNLTPSLVVFPQCHKDAWWTDPQMEAMALKALEQTIKEFHGDPRRVYLTGLSMGGYGTWSFAARHPGRFAALALVCGGIRTPSTIPLPPVSTAADPYADTAQRVGKTPVWVFHGSADPVIPVTESRKMVEALKAAGGNVRYTEYEGAGHNVWEKAYAEPELFPWLLSQTIITGSNK